RRHHAHRVPAPDAHRGLQVRDPLSAGPQAVNESLARTPGRTLMCGMRPSAGQIARVADALVRRLVAADVVPLDAPEERVKARFVALLTKNFDDEEAIDNEALAEAEKLVRKGAPGVRREDLDLRKVEQLVKQRIAKARGFVL